jgi:hypothetical protein
MKLIYLLKKEKYIEVEAELDKLFDEETNEEINDEINQNILHEESDVDMNDL